jgi:hypothetical protein
VAAVATQEISKAIFYEGIKIIFNRPKLLLFVFHSLSAAVKCVQIQNPPRLYILLKEREKERRLLLCTSSDGAGKNPSPFSATHAIMPSNINKD